uniref:Uncharacterized protein n=1 Tax=Cacopsylla melanoneura TaxID=428564 RepID=A0A8D8YXD0_9HEMI
MNRGKKFCFLVALRFPRVQNVMKKKPGIMFHYTASTALLSPLPSGCFPTQPKEDEWAPKKTSNHGHKLLSPPGFEPGSPACKTSAVTTEQWELITIIHTR